MVFQVESSTPKKSTPTSSPSAAVLPTESVHININSSLTTSGSTGPAAVPQVTTGPAVIDVPVKPTAPTPAQAQGLRTIELSSGRVREGFGEFSWSFFEWLRLNQLFNFS